MPSLGSGEAVILLRVILCLRPQGPRPRVNQRCTNGRAGSVSGESEVDNAVSGLRQGGDTIEGRLVSETLGSKASGKSEVLRDPSVGGLG
jgi:hypothetical protein